LEPVSRLAADVAVLAVIGARAASHMKPLRPVSAGLPFCTAGLPLGCASCHRNGVVAAVTSSGSSPSTSTRTTHAAPQSVSLASARTANPAGPSSAAVNAMAIRARMTR
jgi:hypothetical protein